MRERERRGVSVSSFFRLLANPLLQASFPGQRGLFLKKTEQSSTLEILRSFSLKRWMKAELIFVIQFGPVESETRAVCAVEVRQLQGQRERDPVGGGSSNMACETGGSVSRN